MCCTSLCILSYFVIITTIPSACACRSIISRPVEGQCKSLFRFRSVPLPVSNPVPPTRSSGLMLLVLPYDTMTRTRRQLRKKAVPKSRLHLRLPQQQPRTRNLPRNLPPNLTPNLLLLSLPVVIVATVLAVPKSRLLVPRPLLLLLLMLPMRLRLLPRRRRLLAAVLRRMGATQRYRHRCLLLTMIALFDRWALAFRKAMHPLGRKRRRNKTLQTRPRPRPALRRWKPRRRPRR